MDMRASRVLLILAIVVIAWMSKSYWLPKFSGHDNGSFVEQQESTPDTLEEYSTRS